MKLSEIKNGETITLDGTNAALLWGKPSYTHTIVL